MIGSIVLGVVLLVLNGLFVASEFALVSAKRHRLEEIAGAGGRLTRIAARAAVRGGRELSLMLAGAQLGITLCSLGLGMVAEPALEHVLEPVLGMLPESVQTLTAYALALAIVTFLHMVAAEMAPKSWALTHPERAALGLALPFRGFARLVRPILEALNGLTNGLLRLFRVDPRDELASTRTPHQLAMLVAESGRMGMLDRYEHDLLTRTLRAQSQPVGRLMVPISDVASVPADADAEQVKAAAADSGRLRLLVTSGTDVLGVMHVRDAVIEPGRRPAEVAVPAPLIPQHITVPEAVTALQDARAQLGLVTGDDGRVLGVVGLPALIGQLMTA